MCGDGRTSHAFDPLPVNGKVHTRQAKTPSWRRHHDVKSVTGTQDPTTCKAWWTKTASRIAYQWIRCVSDDRVLAALTTSSSTSLYTASLFLQVQQLVNISKNINLANSYQKQANFNNKCPVCWHKQQMPFWFSTVHPSRSELGFIKIFLFERCIIYFKFIRYYILGKKGILVINWLIMR